MAGDVERQMKLRDFVDNQHQPEAEPPLEWLTPPEPPEGPGTPRGDLFRNRPPATLSVIDAITTGFRALGNVNFFVPVMAVGIVVNLVVNAALRPFVDRVRQGGLSAVDVDGVLGSVLAGYILAVIGGVAMNLYGQVWAIQASSGPLPGIGSVVAGIRARWFEILGTGLALVVVSFMLSFAVVLLYLLATSVLGGLGLVALIALGAVAIWIWLRLSMATWLAADGESISRSIRGSWAMTKGSLGRILGWSIFIGLVYAFVVTVLGLVLDGIPVVGLAIGQSLQLALGYGSGVALYRRTQAAANGEDPRFG